jgi:radical SAM/Cys-rich protein
MGSNDFEAHLAPHARSPLRRGRVTTLQLNIGKRCNLACHHCHVESGPRRTEMLDRAGAERVLELLEANPGLECLDITGGAPELNPHFRFIVERARALGRRVVDRCNLTVLYEPGQGDTAEFLADQGVEVVASLPCYTRETLERQRGRGVFAKSIEALRWLNQLGYAKPGRGLRLDLVYNPVGPALPPEQGQLEERYRVELRELFGIEFDALLTLANAPIKRFARQLHCLGRYEEYLSLLVNHFMPKPALGGPRRAAVRLRLQSGARARARRRRPHDLGSRGPGRARRGAHRHRKPLLRVHRGRGLELLRRPGELSFGPGPVAGRAA